jgi:hypothetical protein
MTSHSPESKLLARPSSPSSESPPKPEGRSREQGRTPDQGDIDRVLGLIDAYRQTCVVAAAVQLGVFEELARGEKTCDELAGTLLLHRDGLWRLLRALDALGLVARLGDRASLTNAGHLLTVGGFAPSLRAWTVLVGAEFLALWGRLADSVRTGRSVFNEVFACSPWEHRAADASLNGALNRVTSGEQARALSALLHANDFTRRRCIADIGGGHGNLVAGVLRKYPALRGMIFDLPHVVTGAEAPLARARVADRCRIVGGSFLDSVPSGADVHVLKHVLHNWDDDHCVRILRNSRASIEADGRLLILENVVPADDFATALPMIMLDLHMLVVHGGRERTRDEYETLLGRAGFKLSRHVTVRPGAPDLIEAIPD